jgi:glutamate-1-semialdehyde 2,1-aminomutase
MDLDIFSKALNYLPGGVSYAVRYIEFSPIYVERAEGAFVWDVGGNKFLDFWMGHGALLMGHGYRPVVEAAAEQLKLGAHFGYSHPWEVRWAKQICQMVPSAEMVRPTNSGTEANMYAVRTARGFTGRKLIAKMEGGWHGGYDGLTVGVSYPVDKPSSLGIPEETLANTLLLPFNDLEGVERRVKGRELAAIVVEPVLGAGGFIPADPEFLKGLRELCEQTWLPPYIRRGNYRVQAFPRRGSTALQRYARHHRVREGCWRRLLSRRGFLRQKGCNGGSRPEK